MSHSKGSHCWSYRSKRPDRESPFYMPYQEIPIYMYVYVNRYTATLSTYFHLSDHAHTTPNIYMYM